MFDTYFHRDKVKMVNCGYVDKLLYSGSPFGAAGRWKMFYFHRGGRGIKCEPLNAVYILPAREKNKGQHNATLISFIPSRLRAYVFATATRREKLPALLTTTYLF